jgi:hypothetical protein
VDDISEAENEALRAIEAGYPELQRILRKNYKNIDA